MAGARGGGRRGTKSDSYDDGLRHSQNRQTVFRVPLRAVANPDDIKSFDFHQILSNEYATKYLETLGATPNKSTVAIVKKNVPLAESCIRKHLKGKVDTQPLDGGEHTFESLCSRFLYPFNLHPTLAKQRNPDLELDRGETELKTKTVSAFGAQSGMLQKTTSDGSDMGEMKMLQDDIHKELSQVFTVHPDTISTLQAGFEASVVQWKAEKAPTNFEEHMSDTAFKSAMEMLKGAEVAALFTNTLEYLHSVFIPPPTAHTPKSGSDVRRATLCSTARRTPSPVQLFSQALRASPAHSTESYDRVTPLSDEALARPALQMISQTKRRQVSILPPNAQKVDRLTVDHKQNDEMVQKRRLFAIHNGYANIQAKYRKNPSQLFFTLPLIIFSLRVLVENIFTQLYPLWARTKEGVTALREMDEAVVDLLDPHGYHRNVTVLQSSPSAVRLSVRYQRRAHPPSYRHFSDTSPLVRAALGHLTSHKARTILGGDKAKVWNTELGARQKMTLFQQAWDRLETDKPQHANGVSKSLRGAGL
ncbi:hypothetical protein BSKO_06171 [Bryopsis sp. KO-2023]|nr:hypothetical protein BSKO_06171 [Bryopsis sp. KO-2023]